MPVKLSTVAFLGGASVLTYSGLTGKSITATLQAILQGRQLSSVPKDSKLSILGTPSAAASGAGVSGNSAAGVTIAQDALTYQGHAYLYAGAPGPDGENPWDCSSFVNWVVGHDEAMSIPGGNWTTVTNNGNSHGPNTSSWLAWMSGTKTINSHAVQAGDILLWQTHMGIAISNTDMISALNANLGTRVSTISGGAPGGEILVCRRLKAAT